MGFLRTANAIVTHPAATQRGWGKVRVAGRVAAEPSRSLVSQASEILGKRFDPAQYLLSHCTIVASVDVVTIPGIKVGNLKENGKDVNRKYAEFRVTSETDHYINNNLDCFSREVLLKSYPTFIGGHNFLEHVQVEELSKGRIIDAVARDIGDSIYVDILVATDRRHANLVRDIESGKMTTLSMGCSVEETLCTKCGNVAVDETELCHHIRYEKGNTFFDENGQQHRVAELCGHPTLDPTGGVHFIEGSWVATPAFTGAVMRNIVQMSQMNPRMAAKVQEVLSTLPPEWTSSDEGYRKAANLRTDLGVQGGAFVVGKVSDRRAQFDFGDPAEEEESADPGGETAPEGEAAPDAKADPDMLQKLEDEMVTEMSARLKARMLAEMAKREKAQEPNSSQSSMEPNNNVVREAKVVVRKAYAAAAQTLIRTASSDADFMNSLAVLDKNFGLDVPRDIYRAVLKVGSSSKFENERAFLAACRREVGRPLDKPDAKAVFRLGRTLSLAEALLGSTQTQMTGASHDHERA